MTWGDTLRLAFRNLGQARVRTALTVGGVSIGIASTDTRFVATLMGLRNPESVRYDSTQDVYFISNMSGFGSVKDGDGYIARVSASDLKTASVFIKPPSHIRTG